MSNVCAAKEYDFEDAQIVGGTVEDIKVLTRKREQAKAKTSTEEDGPAEDGPVRFMKRKKVDSQSASAKKPDGQYGAGLSKKKQRLSFEEDEDE